MDFIGPAGVGFLAALAIGVVVYVPVLLVTNTRRWHDRHHRTERRIMCDHCIRTD